jgi:hypothetical protein
MAHVSKLYSVEKKHSRVIQASPRAKYEDHRPANGNAPEEDIQKVGAEAFELFQRYLLLSLNVVTTY